MASRNRGVKKPKLRDLSQHPLSYPEQIALLNAVDLAAPPIAAAILGAVLAEHELEVSLRQRLPRITDDIWLAMLDEQGPYSTFSRKITAGHALRLYDDAFKSNLDIVRVIRNTFAHSKRLIDFDHPLVAAELNKVAIPRSGKRLFSRIKLLQGKPAYVALCMVLARQILHRRNQAHAASDRRVEKRNKKRSDTSPLFRALAPGFGLVKLEPKDGTKSPLQSYLESHTGDPNPSAPQGLWAGLFGAGDELLRKTDKKK